MPALLRTLAAIGVLAAPAGALAAEIGTAVDINAYADLELREATYGDPSLDLDGFRQAHATVMFTARPAARVLLHLRLEAAFGGQADTGFLDEEGEPTIGTGTLSIHGAYAQWTPTPTLRLRAGRLLTPWGFYNELHDASPAYPAVHLPYSIYHPMLFDGFHTYVQAATGLSVAWQGEPLRLQLMLSNGVVDGNEAYSDDNSSPGVLFRVETDPVRPVATNLSLFYSLMGSDEHMVSGIWGLRLSAGPWSDTTEISAGWMSGMTQLGGATELESTHLRGVTPFVRGEFFLHELGHDHVALTGVAGLKVDLGMGHIILKLDHVSYFYPMGDEEGGGELRAAVVGWF